MPETFFSHTHKACNRINALAVERLTLRRQADGLTVGQLANLADMTAGHLRDIESGQRYLTVADMICLAVALETSLSYFCEGACEAAKASLEKDLSGPPGLVHTNTGDAA